MHGQAWRSCQALATGVDQGPSLSVPSGSLVSSAGGPKGLGQGPSGAVAGSAVRKVWVQITAPPLPGQEVGFLTSLGLSLLSCAVGES